MTSYREFFDRKLLLVEGPNDKDIFEVLLEDLGVEGVGILNYEGRTNLASRLRAYVATPGFDRVESIGIVRDADSDHEHSANSALQSVQGALGNAGLPVPTDFLIPATGPPRVSVFVMPNNSENGEMEDLCLTALQDDPAMSCVEDFIQCVNDSVGKPPKKLSKAKLHAFLASREEPEPRLKEAAKKGYFPWKNSAFQSLRDFLKAL